MLCPNCIQSVEELKIGESCPHCGSVFKGGNNKKNSRKNEPARDKFREEKSFSWEELLTSPFSVFFKAFDSFILLILFDMAVFRFVQYDVPYSYSNVPLAENISRFLLIIFVTVVNLLFFKRILYQIKGEEINILKIFSLSGLFRGIKVFFNLVVINILPLGFTFGFFMLMIEFAEDPPAFASLASLIFGLIFLLVVIFFVVLAWLYLSVANFTIIEHETSIADSLDYASLLLQGKKIKLSIMISLLVLAFSFFIGISVTSMTSWYMTPEEVARVESFITNSQIFGSYCFFILNLGFYHTLAMFKESAAVKERI